MKHLKRILYTFLDYIICAVVSFIYLTFIFNFKLQGVFNTVLTSLIAFVPWASLYIYYWKNARKDWRYIKSETKRNPGFSGKFNFYLGFLYSLPFVVFNAALAILALKKSGVFSIVFRVINMCCMGFMINENAELNTVGVTITVIMPLVVSTAGYIVGRTGFSISETYFPKLIYKNTQKKK